MNRARILLIFMLALAILPAGLAARSAPRLPAAAFGTASQSVVVAGEEGAMARATKPTRPCMRGVLPLAPCGADLAPWLALPGPADTHRGERLPILAVDMPSGLPPTCLLGPPRSC